VRAYVDDGEPVSLSSLAQEGVGDVAAGNGLADKAMDENGPRRARSHFENA